MSAILTGCTEQKRLIACDRFCMFATKCPVVFRRNKNNSKASFGQKDSNKNTGVFIHFCDFVKDYEAVFRFKDNIFCVQQLLVKEHCCQTFSACAWEVINTETRWRWLYLWQNGAMVDVEECWQEQNAFFHCKRLGSFFVLTKNTKFAH